MVTFSLGEVEFDSTVFEPEKAERIREMMRRDFPVEKLRLLSGAYVRLVKYYVKDRYEQYNDMQVTFEDLAEMAYEDFRNWTEADFRLADSRLLRDLRNHFVLNGIAIEKRAGLPVVRAMATALSDPNAIPFATSRDSTFVRTIEGPVRQLPQPLLRTQGTGDGNGQPPVARQQSTLSISSNHRAKLVDITKCIRNENKYRGLPDEDFNKKRMYFSQCLELSRITEEVDKLSVLPFFLADQAALTYRTSIQGTVSTVEDALDKLQQIFLSEEARRANDTVWDALTYSFVKKVHQTDSARETLRQLYSEIERLRNSISSAATGNTEVTQHITRAKLLSAVSSEPCFAHVRANPPKDYLKLRSALYDAATQVDTGALKKKVSSDMAKEISHVMYTDREMRHRERRNVSRNSNSWKRKNVARKNYEPKYAGKSKICWVCGEPDCHSSRHPREERIKERARLCTFATEALGSENESTEEEKSENQDTDSNGDDAESSSFATSLHAASFLFRVGINPAKASDFVGLVLDTGCSKVCTSSEQQYRAYCRYTGQKPSIVKEMAKVFNTSAGAASSIGVAKVVIPFGKLSPALMLEVHIFGPPSTAPLLLAYAVMRQ